MTASASLLNQIKELRRSVKICDAPDAKENPNKVKRLVSETGMLISELQRFREDISPIHFGSIGITLGRSDSIAKFFAFSFTNQDKVPLKGLFDSPFYGSGIIGSFSHMFLDEWDNAARMLLKTRSSLKSNLKFLIEESRKAPRKSPWGAGILSAIIPGTG